MLKTPTNFVQIVKKRQLILSKSYEEGKNTYNIKSQAMKYKTRLNITRAISRFYLRAGRGSLQRNLARVKYDYTSRNLH